METTINIDGKQVAKIQGGSGMESNVAEMSFAKVEISGVEINVTTNQQVACVETTTNGVKVMFEQAKPREITLNIDGKMLGQSIVGGIETIKQKNTPKGACEENCSKCNCVNPPMPRFPGDNFGGKCASGPSMECPY